MESFDDYLASLEHPEHRARLSELFAWIEGEFPTLQRKLAWNQPMYTDHGTYIIGFSTAKGHMSVAPEQAGMERFTREITASGYSSTKGLFRIKWTQPIDHALLKTIITFNMADKADYTTFWR